MWSNYFMLPNPSLQGYFSRVRQGQPNIYRAPFAGGSDTPVEEVLNAWAPAVESLSRTYPGLYSFENDLRKKVGPMSVMKPLSQRLADIDAYYEDIHLPQEPIDDRALTKVINRWAPVSGMVLRSAESTVQHMKVSTNSGSPFFTKRKRVISNTLPAFVFPEDEEVFQQLRDNMWHSCAVLGWRGQEGGPTPEDVKQRVVWMFPFAVNIQELRVYQPLIELAQRNGIVPAWNGLNAVDHQITRLFDTKKPQDAIMCTDFTKFDQHFNPSCSDGAKRILEGILSPTRDNGEWLSEVYPVKYMIPLAYDWRTIRKGPHGMGSGSGGTNADETLLHSALQEEAALFAGAHLNPYSACLGDDGILTYPGLKPEHVVDVYRKHGLDMNESKQSVSSEECSYLRRWYHRAYRPDGICRGVYSTYRAIGRLCEQERYYDPDKWNEKMVALRQLSIIENVKWHPLREKFADFCMARDKYRLGIDIPGFLDSLTKEAQTAIDYIPDFLGYTRSLEGEAGDAAGINDWWIVKYLRSKK